MYGCYCVLHVCGSADSVTLSGPESDGSVRLRVSESIYTSVGLTEYYTGRTGAVSYSSSPDNVSYN